MNRLRTPIVPIAALVLLLAACQSEPPKAEQAKPPEKSAEEASQDEPSEERRIVSLGGTVTEIVYALGAGGEVVGVDKSSVYPGQTEAVRKLDLFRKVSAEAVLSFEPTLVVATESAKPDKAFERIEKAGVEILRVSAEETPEAARARIETIGKALGEADAANKLVRTLDEELVQAKKAAEACRTPAKTLFMYARGRGTTFVAGKDTSAARMIELAGAKHVPSDIDGFKPMTAEAVMAANPDVVLMTDSGLESLGGVEGLRQVKGLSETRAAKEGRVVTMGDLELLGFGPRTGKAVKELAGKLCLDAAVSKAGE